MRRDATSSAEGRRAVLGRHLEATRSRLDHLGSASRTADAAGIGRNAYTAVEHGTRVAQASTWAKIEDALSWPAGSAAAYLEARGPLPEAAMRTALIPGLPDDVAAVLATRNARTTAEQVAVLQGIVLDLVRATSGDAK